MFKLLWQEEKGGGWVEVMTGSRDEIYKWIDAQCGGGYNSKIERV
jgi:hypothetical protein